MSTFNNFQPITFQVPFQPFLAIGQGLVSEVKHRAFFGNNPNLASGVEEVVWPGPTAVYTFPSDTGESMRLVSTNVADNQTILIQALDSNWDEVNVSVTLNGTTPVTIPGNLSRINRAFNVSSTAFAGQVNITNAGGTTVYATLLSSDQITTQMIFSIPNNYNARITTSLVTMNAASGAASARALFRYVRRNFGSVFLTGGSYGLNKPGTTATTVHIETVTPLQPKSDIMLLATSDTNGVDVSARIPIILYKVA